jgi:glutamine amidotransferase
MIAIVNYGLGNLGSIQNMLKAIGEKCLITSDPEKIKSADKLILPGVGSFDAGMGNLEKTGLDLLLKKEAGQGKPILGICLGMQLLGRKSEEGGLPGLGLIPFDNVRFNFPKDSKLKIPHMGWDIIKVQKETPISQGFAENERFYFVHSYHAKCDREENVLFICNYGYSFAAGVVSGNVYGVQFHPEKSHHFGMMLLDNFAKRCN